MMSDIAAGKCDNSGKPTGVNSLTATGTIAAFTASALCTKPGEHHPDATAGASVLPKSRRQSDVSADRNLVHKHDRNGP